MVFIESPVGVGFSYAEDESDYKVGDVETALQNYNFIIGFLRRFPALQKNTMAVASESYGGHYTLSLAKTIVVKQSQPDVGIKLNFKVPFLVYVCMPSFRSSHSFHPSCLAGVPSGQSFYLLP